MQVTWHGIASCIERTKTFDGKLMFDFTLEFELRPGVKGFLHVFFIADPADQVVIIEGDGLEVCGAMPGIFNFTATLNDDQPEGDRLYADSIRNVTRHSVWHRAVVEGEYRQ